MKHGYQINADFDALLKNETSPRYMSPRKEEPGFCQLPVISW